MKTIKTAKGTELPLLNLKGKDYLMVAYRLQWLAEEYPFYNINSEFLVLTDDQTVTRSTVSIFNEAGRLIRQATATKRESKKDFPDHTEKSETSSIGRALSMLGLGTAQAISDLDEGVRLADSPLQDVRPPKAEAKATPSVTLVGAVGSGSAVTTSVTNGPTAVTSHLPLAEAPAPKANSFRKPKATPVAPVADSGDQWK